MSRKSEQELRAAKNHAEFVLDLVQKAQSKLSTASSLGIYDMLTGGIISSMLKRSRMREVNDLLDAIDYELDSLSKVLAEVEIEYIEGFKVDMTAEFLDVWFDNIFTDISVQNDIKEVQRQLDQLAEQMDELAHYLITELNR